MADIKLVEIKPIFNIKVADETKDSEIAELTDKLNSLEEDGSEVYDAIHDQLEESGCTGDFWIAAPTYNVKRESEWKK